MLILPIHEHRMCFHLFVSSSISSVSYNFPSTGHLPTLLNLFLGIFYTIVNGIVFLISLSNNSLLVYENTTNFEY